MKTLDKNTIRAYLSTVVVPGLLAINVLADSIADSQLGQGLVNLFQDLSTWLVILSAAAGIAMAGYYIFRRIMADEQDGKLWEKRIKTAIICGVAGALVGGIVRLIASYF